MARIIVIGGGTAGSAAALALHKAGLDVSVYEAHPDSAEDIGAFLTLASNGMRALAQLGASTAVTGTGFPLTTMRVLDGSGTEVVKRPLAGADDPLLQYRCLRRGELNAALQAEAVRRGIGVRHGARVESVEEGPEHVTVRFTDGGTATGDLLIGADGLNSTVRRAIAPAVQPGYAGEHVFYGYTTDAPAAGPSDLFTLIRGSEAAFGYAVSPAGETYWFARVTGDPLSAEDLANGTPGGWRDLLLPLLRKDSTPAADMVAATTDSVLVTNATEMPLATTWRSGRALLIGDAAHAASPATGQGASMALEDAVVLAKALRDAPDTDGALTAYETLRRPRVEHNVTTSGQISRNARPGTAQAPLSDEDLARHLDWNISFFA
ncbi:FAD-dependent oxidoreductase [Streptomyces spongiae]|uniref:FAD-dependent monooxygenase n=1 Tax=Streptomyces spongiae TaxID=565072 RepID=A0A5N8XX28_9ACTN|nr:NAD(P)/FAD-dependent oxidoreductase [Streptomyces spongiae]MPY63822.1 FAD-dependent monooxygenase [Streptomyces spongiae]